MARRDAVANLDGLCTFDPHREISESEKAVKALACLLKGEDGAKKQGTPFTANPAISAPGTVWSQARDPMGPRHPRARGL
jgi:hypothetical protein